MSGCERVRLTVACRKLIVMNCLECELNVSALSSSIMIGDCRAIVFGGCSNSYPCISVYIMYVCMYAFYGFYFRTQAHELLSQIMTNKFM